ncbi:hypothetical protein ACFVP0_27705 [Streptomyces cinereoruber]|uniref:hypothetical protein n=1 Tax=Streptomyces cinereoruber TaxID=67260 RepID=UPI0036CC8080
MTVELSSAGFRTTIERLRLRCWLLGPGQPSEVIDTFPAANGDFTVVVDDRADTHIASADGRFYFGYFPGGRPGAEHEGWVIAVTGTAKAPRLPDRLRPAHARSPGRGGPLRGPGHRRAALTVLPARPRFRSRPAPARLCR